MRLLIVISLFFSVSVFGQSFTGSKWFDSQIDAFRINNLKSSDTILIYYNYLGPWSDLHITCTSIDLVSILWLNKNKCYLKNIKCFNDSIDTEDITEFSSFPIMYFLKNEKNFEQFKKKSDRKKVFVSCTDVSIEYLILINNDNKMKIWIYDHDFDECNDYYRENKWGKAIISTVDTTRQYFLLNVR